MTTLIVKSDSKRKTLILMQLAEELGLAAKASDFEELNINAMVNGIGRKATDDELIDYLSNGNDVEPIRLETAFSNTWMDKAFKLNIKITPQALRVIDAIAYFVELKNTRGSGDLQDNLNWQ